MALKDLDSLTLSRIPRVQRPSRREHIGRTATLGCASRSPILGRFPESPMGHSPDYSAERRHPADSDAPPLPSVRRNLSAERRRFPPGFSAERRHPDMIRHPSRGFNALIPLTPAPRIDATGAIPTHAFESWTACWGHDNILRNGLTKARTDSFWTRVLGQGFGPGFSAGGSEQPRHAEGGDDDVAEDATSGNTKGTGLATCALVHTEVSKTDGRPGEPDPASAVWRLHDARVGPENQVESRIPLTLPLCLPPGLKRWIMGRQ